METRNELIQDILEHKIIVILRGFTTQELVDSVEAMWKGGIRLVEVTFDQSGHIDDRTTAHDIRVLVETFKNRVKIGAGTVITEEQVVLAKEAGAGFIISPDTCKEIIEKTRELELVSLPGAFTPTEAANAHRWGADFVKLFPNSEVNLSYFKAISTPLSHIKFLAVGGVTAETVGEYLAAGAAGIGVATAIANKKLIRAGEFDTITQLAAQFVNASKSCTEVEK